MFSAVVGVDDSVNVCSCLQTYAMTANCPAGRRVLDWDGCQSTLVMLMPGKRAQRRLLRCDLTPTSLRNTPICTSSSLFLVHRRRVRLIGSIQP